MFFKSRGFYHVFSNIFSLTLFLTKQRCKVFFKKIIRLQRKSSCTYYLSITTVLGKEVPTLSYLFSKSWLAFKTIKTTLQLLWAQFQAHTSRYHGQVKQKTDCTWYASGWAECGLWLSSTLPVMWTTVSIIIVIKRNFPQYFSFKGKFLWKGGSGSGAASLTRISELKGSMEPFCHRSRKATGQTLGLG